MRLLMPVFIWAAVFSFAVNFLMFAPALYMMQIFDRVLTARSEATLVSLTAILVVCMAVMALIDLLRTKALAYAGMLMERRYAATVLHRQLLAKATGLRPGAGVQELTEVRMFFGGQQVMMLFDVPWLPMYLAAIYMADQTLFLMSLVGMAVIMCLTFYSEIVNRQMYEKSFEKGRLANETLQSLLQGAETIHANGMMRGCEQLFRKLTLGDLTEVTAIDRGLWVQTFSKTFRQLFQSLMVGMAAWLVVHQGISPGVMIASTVLFGRAMAPIDALNAVWRQFYSAREALRKLTDWVEFGPDGSGLAARSDAPAVYEVNGLSVKRGERIDLDRVSFRLRPGEHLAVVGPSGAGKTTLIRSLVGVKLATAGEVRLFGVPIDDLRIDDFEQVGYLPQSIDLLPGTVFSNIARMRTPEKESTRVAVAEAIRLAGIDTLVASLPQGLETRLDGRGEGLSVGQRQRIALARALYGGPKVVVLDEPSASLDEPGERAMRDCLQRIKEAGIACIVASHRPSMLTTVDTVLVLHSGRLALYGPRDEVLQKIAPAWAGELAPRLSGVATG